MSHTQVRHKRPSGALLSPARVFLFYFACLCACGAGSHGLRVLLVPSIYPARMYPLQELSRELLARNHTVEMLAYEATPQRLLPKNDSGVHMSLVEGKGARIVAAFDAMKQKLLERPPSEWLVDFIALSGEMSTDIALALDRLLADRSEDELQDIVVVADLDHPGAILAAHKHSVHAVEFLPQLFHPHGRWDCTLLSWIDVPNSMVPCSAHMSPLQRGKSFLTSLALVTIDYFYGFPFKDTAARRELGLPIKPFSYCRAPNHPVLVAGAPGLGAPVYPFPPHILLTGPWISEHSLPPLSPLLHKWLDAHPVVLYVCYGTSVTMSRVQVHIAANAIRALLADHHHLSVLWSLPIDRQPLLPPFVRLLVEENRVVLVPFSPQKTVLAHENVRAFVSQCGSNSVTEGLFFGKPLLAMPFPNLDQEQNALRVVDFGAAVMRTWSNELDPLDIARLMHHVLSNATLQQRARDAKYYLRRTGGVQRAADALEDINHIGWAHLLTPTLDHSSLVVTYKLDVLCVLVALVGGGSILMHKCCWSRCPFLFYFVLFPFVAALIFSGRY